jgi:hypothetical protein
MAYVQPQLKIHEEFTTAQASGVSPLYACLVGPKYKLHRYSQSAEKALLGAYSPSVALTGAYPGKVAGGVVDQASVSVWLEKGRLAYYSGADFAMPAGSAAGTNKLASDKTLRASIGYDRDAAFGSRDVSLNDRVEVTWTEGADTGYRATRVMGFINEVEAAVENVVAGANKAAVAVGSVAVASNTIDALAELTPAAVAGSAYSGIRYGYPEEVYTVRVTKSGGSGVAEAMILSDSGTDDVLNKVVNFTSTDIGTRGVKLKLTADSGTGLLTLGEEIVVNASQTYAVPTLTPNATYGGPADTTYIVQCMLGGTVGINTVDNPAPAYKVTTTNGVDAMASTQILAAGSIAIGNYGVCLTVASGAKFCKGDSWTVKANADTFGAIKTMVLADKLVDETDANIKCTTASTVTIKIGLPADVKLPRAAYALTSSAVTVPAGLTYRGNYLGSDQTFPVMAGDMYVDYREFIASGANEVRAVGSSADVLALLGPASESNPLALAADLALANSGGSPVYYVQVASDDVAGYTAALDATTNTQEVYSLVPLTKAEAVKSLVAAHVADQSSAYKNNWRIAWFGSSIGDQKPVYVSEAGMDVLATVVKPGGNEYADLISSNGKFVTNEVAVGDVIRYNYQPSTSGVTTYTEGVVVAVVSEDELRISALDEENFDNEIKIELWRPRSQTAMAGDIAAESNGYGNRRVRNIWPDALPLEDGTEVPSQFLAAALAGLRSGSAPHQPLTNVSIAGFGIPTRTNMFPASDLNTIAGGGTWIVMSSSGDVITRHQLTTDMSDINMREDTVTCNVDSLARRYRSGFADLTGKGNVSQEMLDVIRMRLLSVSSAILAVAWPAAIGPQMQGFDITGIWIDPVLKDQVHVRVTPLLPYPLNNLDVYITI